MVDFRIEVKSDVCIGDKACCEEAPATFFIDEHEQTIIVRDPPADPLESLIAAARCCPMDAIAILNRESGERIWPRA